MADKSKLQIWIEYAAARSVMGALGAVPGWLAVRIGIAIAWVTYHLHGKLRMVGRRSLELAYPEKSAAERTALLKGSFRSLGRTLGVACGFRKVTRENINDLIDVEFDDEFAAAFKKARDERRGLVILTGHVGNWELFALAYSIFFGPSNLLSRRMDNPKLDRLIGEFRSAFGNRQIDKVNAAAPILKILRSGEAVGILADVNSHPKEGVFVPFFGIPACTTSGVAMLALRANALIIPMFAVWNEARGRYAMIGGPIIEPVSTGDREADIERITGEFTAAIERVVRQYPEQWIWMHRRWKTRPAGKPELYN